MCTHVQARPISGALLGLVDCAICRTPVPLERHSFFAGTPARPAARWEVIAPRYFASSSDFRSVVASFCSAACSARWHIPRTIHDQPKGESP